MLHDLQAAISEYIGWLQLEANRSPNTVRAYQSELARLTSFLAANGHSLALGDLRHEDLRAINATSLGISRDRPRGRAHWWPFVRGCAGWPERASWSAISPTGSRCPSSSSACPSRSIRTSWPDCS